MATIRVENLTKKYKNGVQALDGLTLTVKEGEIFSSGAKRRGKINPYQCADYISAPDIWQRNHVRQRCLP